MTEDSKPPDNHLQMSVAELERFPPPVVDNFRRAHEVLSGRLAEETVQQWSDHGLAIARKTVRSWEAAAEYYDASPAVQQQLPAGQFLRWARTGTSLCDDSPSLAVAYFRASPAAILRLRPRYIDDWAMIGRSLYRGTWKSSALSCRVFEGTPKLLETISFEEFGQFGAFLEALSRRSYDVATECLAQSLELFPRLGGDVSSLVALGRSQTDTSWRDVKGLFDSAASALPGMSPQHRGPLLSLARRLVGTDGIDAGNVLTDGAAALNAIPADNRDELLQLADSLAAISPESAPEFLRSAPTVLERVTFAQLQEWQSEGALLCRTSPAAAASFFRMESARSEEVLDALSSSIELVRVSDILRMYCRALVAKEIEIQATRQLVDKRIGWVEGDTPTTEGSTIFLPGVVNRYTSKDHNFQWFKVISTHQAGHIEFGSFDFDYDRPSTMFEDIRPLLKEGRQSETEEPADDEVAGPGEPDSGADEGGAEKAFLTDMSRFFNRFNDNQLVLDIFTVNENTRIDARVLHEYPGISVAYLRTQSDSLNQRPEMESLPARQTIMEFMVRLSLGQTKGLRVPKEHAETARKVRRLIRMLRSPEATVEDTAEATIRIYSLLEQITNKEVDEDEFETIDHEDEETDPEEGGLEDFDPEAIAEQLAAGLQMSDGGQEDDSQGDDEEPGMEYESPQEVDYRGDFKPELGQLLSQMMLDPDGEGGEAEGMQPISAEQLEELMKNAAELDIEPGEDGKDDQQSSEMLENLMKELARREPNNQQFSQGPMSHVDEDGGPLQPTGNDSYVYDEWDFRANEYKPRWCLVHEKEIAYGEASFYQETLTNYASLVRRIRKQFELVVPEMYRKQKRLEDGEEHDLDAVIEALTDLRTGHTPDEKLYWRRNKTERSVAVAFLLDMSASTAEAIDETKRGSDDWAAPDDPVEYMVWLRSRRAEGLRRSYKRIIDVEKEGIVLLVNALEGLGDDYGIYGFSGYGRENVEFYIIKDIDEKFTNMIPRRIDRIAPLHATRMGPAIRHATSKLINQEARSRFMFLISDGRPQDRGYSREGVEKEYAVHDTRMALIEARREGVTPFCLTVDRDGHDYLKTMMQDFSYEVLSDITLLPQRLPQLYRRLTT